MKEYRIDVDGDLLASLSDAFNRGEIVDFVNGEPVYRIEKVQVDRFGPLKLQIFSKEHPPPHFHVTCNGSSASYCISGCHRQEGTGSILRFEKTIRDWWSRNKTSLIRTWDERRPSDCPVGVYQEGCDCQDD